MKDRGCSLMLEWVIGPEEEREELGLEGVKRSSEEPLKAEDDEILWEESPKEGDETENGTGFERTGSARGTIVSFGTIGFGTAIVVGGPNEGDGVAFVVNA